jgi:hypothetical protein
MIKMLSTKDSPIQDKPSEQDLKKTLFVFYTKPTKYWKYENIPEGWEWIGCGRTYPFPVDQETIPKYTNEEQFTGPSKNETEMVLFLEQEFQKLKEEKTIDCFEIKQSYM